MRCYRKMFKIQWTVTMVEYVQQIVIDGFNDIVTWIPLGIIGLQNRGIKIYTVNQSDSLTEDGEG